MGEQRNLVLVALGAGWEPSLRRKISSGIKSAWAQEIRTAAKKRSL